MPWRSAVVGPECILVEDPPSHRASGLRLASGRSRRGSARSYWCMQSMAKSPFRVAESLTGGRRFNLDDLSRLTGLTTRRIRQLIDLGAIDRAQWPNCRLSYDAGHLVQARQASALLALDMSAKEVANLVAELSPSGRPPEALKISGAPGETPNGTGWLAGEVTLSFPVRRSGAEERLMECVRLAVQRFIQQERAIRRCLQSNL